MSAILPSRSCTALLALVLSSPAAADIVPCSPGVPQSVICLTNDVSDTSGGGPLVAGQVYHVSGSVTVPAGQRLTAESGAILKFSTNGGLDVLGTLDCGAAIFTSLADDTAGGDTNGDGPSMGAPGDWGGLVFFFASSAASVVDGAVIRYGTTGVEHFGTATDSADVTHMQLEVRSCSGVGFSTGLFSRPTVTGCTFQDNRLAAQANIGALPGLIGNGASGNSQGDCIEIIEGTVSGSVTIGVQNTLDGRAFAICPSVLVEVGATLDLQPGVVFKFGGILGLGGVGCSLGDVSVLGTLFADGVVFTSLEDDTIGGDLDKSGASIGTPGDFGRFIFQGASTSVLRNTLIRFGGAATLAPFAAPAIDLLAADIVLENVDVVECSAQGLRLNEGVNASFPTVMGCSLSNNLGTAVDRVPVAAVAGFSNNTASGNLLDTMEISGGFLDGFASVDKQNSLNADGAFLLGGTLTVNAGAELVLGAGVALKWPMTSAVLAVSGVLTATGTVSEPVVLTSRADDSVVGDSNKDGGATEPAPGDWVGVDLRAGADASLLDGVSVRYAGRAGQASAAVVISCDPTLLNTVVELSESGAVDLKAFAQPTLSGCTFRDNGGLAVANAILHALPGFTLNTATGNALGDFIEVVNGDVSFGEAAAGSSLEFGPDNALAPDRVFVVDDDIDVPAGFLLSILGGTLVKWRGSRQLDVAGALQVGSVGGDTAVFTSLADDSVAGDTAKDGFTEGTPGEWQGLVVRAPGTLIENALVHFAGGIGGMGVHLINADAQLKDLRVEDCLGAGLHLNSDSLPVVDGSSFDRNDVAVDGVPLRALPGFSNSTAEDNKVGDYQRITDGSVTSNVLIRSGQAVNGGVFVYADDLDVLAGAKLTIDPGVTFKAEGDRSVDVDGTLITSGVVVITTLTDDINGDTNEDMDATAPVPGSWQGLSFHDDSSDSVIAGLRVRYAGSGSFGGGPAVELDQADVTILDALVEYSGAQGMLLRNDARPEVRDSSFVDNEGIAVDGLTVGAIEGFVDNTAVGNVSGDYMRVNGSTMGSQTTISRFNALNGSGVFVVNTDVLVGVPNSLTLRPGTIFKFEGFNRSLVSSTGVLNVEGTGLEPVVLTSVHDDSVGGDTRKDGAATAPMPGDWGRFEIGFAALPGRIEHLHARYGGFGAFAAIELENDFTSARSIRADHSASDGIRGQRHAGDAVNWVAFGCLGDGIDLAGGSYDLLHATVADNGAVGIRKNLGHTGSLWSAISSGNGGSAVSGFALGEVLFSNVGPAFVGSDGNLDADPLFVDLASGDLCLGAGSPCIDAGDFSAALGVVEDHREASRILDDGFDGSVAPDMGAFERALYTLSFGGEPRVGTQMTFTADGPPEGFAVFTLGLLDGATFVDPLGFTLFGTLENGAVLGFAPTGQPIVMSVPPSGTSVGTEFGVQALVRSYAGAIVRGSLGLPVLPVPLASDGDARATAELLRSTSSGAARVGHYTNLYRGFVGP